MSNPHDLNASTYFENRRTHFNSQHNIDEERVSGNVPAQQPCGAQRVAAPSTRFPPSPRQYAAHEFGLCEDEEFRHPRMFENLAYETDASAFEAMRRQNARPPYQQQPRFNISDLPSEQIADFSNPQFSGAYDEEEECNVCPQQQQTPHISEISAPDFCDISDASPWPEQSPPMTQQQQQQQRQSYTSECLDDVSAPMYDSPVGTPTPQPHYTPIGLMDTPDVCAPTPPAPTPTPPPHFSPIRFQPSPVQYPSECLEDISTPTFAQTPGDVPRSPSPRRVQMAQNLPSDMIFDVSPPSFASPPTPSLSFPSEALDEMTMPSFENTSCGSPLDRRFLLDPRLADESPPHFATSGSSSSRRSYSRGNTPCPPAECQSQQPYEATTMRKRSSPPRRFNLPQNMSQRSSPSRCPSSVCTPTPPAPHFSLRSPTPVGGYSLPDECLMDVSEPTLYRSQTMSPYARPFPENLPSECLGDISEPSYQMTPPARTPSMPHDLPLEQICDISQPMYDSPRSEHLSSISMPAFDDTSCGSPLDRRFLLDPNIMDESPPYFPSSTASSPSRPVSPCVQPTTPRRSPSSRGQSSRVTSPQRSMSSRHFSPLPSQQRSRSLSPICSPTPPAPHFSLRSPSPIKTPPLYFSGPRREPFAHRPFPSNMTSECLADISAPSYTITTTPKTPSMPHDLPSDMICDISQPMYQSPGSEHLSAETMPSFADTSCGSPLDRRFLHPSMGSSRARSVSPKRPSTPGARDDSSFDKTYCEILQRFTDLKHKIDTQEPGGPGSPSVGSKGMPSDECIRETVIERTENENGQLEKTTQYIAITIDPSGSIKTHTKEIKTQFPHSSPGRLAPPSWDSGVHTQNSMPATQIENLRSGVRRRLSFDLSDMPSENLVDMSPPYASDLPSMSTENILQHLSSVPEEQLSKVSAPSFRTPPTPSISYPSEMLEEMTIPSFENTSCGSPLDRRFLLDPRLADESPPKFASSYSTSPPSGNLPYTHSRTPTHSSARCPQRSQNATNLTRQDLANGPSSRRLSLRSSLPSEAYSPTPPAPHFSLHSPTPIGSPPGRAFPTNLPSEQLMDISEPAFFSGPPRASPQMRYPSSDFPSERLDDISQPSYQQTPPPRTPVFPTDLPSEMLGNISTPSYRSPASEHISRVSMPSFEDVSYESPLDRRFLLDPRIADETMPTLPEMQSTLQSSGTPRAQTARRRLSYSQPDSARGNVSRDGNMRTSSEGRGGHGKLGPATVEKTHTTIKQSGSYQQQHSVTPGMREGKPSKSPQQRGQSPLISTSKEQLNITTSVHSITHIYTKGDTEGPTGSQGQRRSMSLPSDNLADVGRSQQRRGPVMNQNFIDASFPSGSRSTKMSSTRRPQQRKISSAPLGPPSQRTSRRISIQDINDISPISFASTIPSTDRSGSIPRRGCATGKYTSTSSRGLSGLANYAPFFEQIRSRNNSNACDPCSPSCPTVQDYDPCDPCAGFINSRSNKDDAC